MTRTQRRSKSRLHNRWKRAGFKWWRNRWWESWRFDPFLIRVGHQVPLYHYDYEEAKNELTGNEIFRPGAHMSTEPSTSVAQAAVQKDLEAARQWAADRQAEGWTREDFLQALGEVLGVEEHPPTAYHLERVESDIRRATGKRYQIDLRKLASRELDELARLVRDIQYEAETRAKSMVRRQPWKFMGS